MKRRQFSDFVIREKKIRKVRKISLFNLFTSAEVVANNTLALALIFSLLIGFPGMRALYADHDPFDGVPQTSVEICHETGNNGGFVSNSPNISSTDGTPNGHGAGHEGDIIPPYHYLDKDDVIQSYPGQNWDAEGQAFWENDCEDPNEDPPTANTGSIQVCKIIVDNEGSVTDGSEAPETTFTVVVDPSPEGGEDAFDAIFDTELDLNENIGSELINAECVTFSNLPYNTYFYSEESIEGDGSSYWEAPLFSENGTTFVTHGAAGANGDVVVNDSTPDRLIVIKNTLKADVCLDIEGIQIDPLDCDDTIDPPTEVDNSCLVPVAPEEGDKITSFGESFGGEKSLQEILDDASYALDTISDETGYQAWNVPGGTTSVTISGLFVEKISASSAAFGYYVDNDISTFVPIFKTAGLHTAVAPVISVGNPVPSFNIPTADPLVTTIGFAIDNQDGNGNHQLYATKSSLNISSEDHVVVYNPEENKYVLGFENLPFTPAEIGDEDYQDLVVELDIEECEEENGGGDPSADLEISKTVSDDSVDQDQEITYTLSVTNHGPDTANNVEVNDVLPVELSYLSDNPSQGDYDEVLGVWTIGTLLDDQTVTLEIVVTVDADSGTIHNEAVVDLDPDIDNNPANDTDNVDIAVEDDEGGGGGDNSFRSSSSGGGGGSSQTNPPPGEVLGEAIGLPRTGAGDTLFNILMLMVSGLITLSGTIALFTEPKKIKIASK